MKYKILVIDDDRKIVDLVRLYLEKDGYQVFVAFEGLEALKLARQQQPDLIVLDLLLPGLDGLDICRILRSESEVPIIMLTAKTTEDDMLTGLDLGADDYVTKPFSPRELVARIRTVLRRIGKIEPEIPAETRFGDLVINRGSHEVWIRGELVSLTPTEFKLLDAMTREPRQVFTRVDLLDKVFGTDFEGFGRTIDVHVKNLRKKIELDSKKPAYIKTVFGVGYKFDGGCDE